MYDHFRGRDVISIRDFRREEIDFVLETALGFEGRRDQSLGANVLGALFFEASTRTRLSFEAAMSMLGGRYISFAEPGATSIAKGETLADTIRVVEGYCDVIVMRHPLEGAARLAADVGRIPIINGGDGANQHPTQTLLDLFTIRKAMGRLEGLRLAMVGDLRYGRTVHSLAEALTRYPGCELTFVAPLALRMPAEVCQTLDRAGTSYREIEHLEDLGVLDILYVTRIQEERFPDPIEAQRVRDVFKLDLGILDIVGSGVKIMHPLPRVNEIATELDDFEGSLYFQQAHNGVTVRQTLLALLLGAVS